MGQRGGVDADEAPGATRRIPDALIAFLLAGLLVLPWFYSQRRLGLDLGDEGFLWYGAVRVLHGEWPLRDFQSYDPGRYLWCAAGMAAMGDEGVLALRATVAVFQWLGLGCGVLVLLRAVRSPPLVGLGALTFLLWMFPRHKLFEPAISMMLVYVGVLLVERPTLRRHIVAGVAIGGAGFFGRNLGLYAALGYLAIALLLWTRLRNSRLSLQVGGLTLGTLIGYSPMLALCIVVPGFASGFWNALVLMFSRETMNLPLPVPWPWLIVAAEPQWLFVRSLMGGLFFLIVLVFCGTGLLALGLLSPTGVRSNPIFVSSVLVGLGYAQHVFSRADLGHLAQGIFPVLVGLAGVPLPARLAAAGRAAIVVVLCALSLGAAGTATPVFERAAAPGGAWVEVELGRDVLSVEPATGAVVRAVQEIDRRVVPRGETILIAPHWPALYVILGRRAPMRDIYNLFPTPVAVQDSLISELRRSTNWAIIGDVALDGREELRFKRTHPRVWAYLERCFEVVPSLGLPDTHRLLRRRSAIGSAKPC